MQTDKKKLFVNTLAWGVALWFFGYALGFVFFALVPPSEIGWYVTPFGVALTLWVLYTKIARHDFTCYVALGVIWALIAILLDYLFIVKLLGGAGYYKPDVYLYYALTLALPIIVGWHKLHRAK